MKLRQFSKRDKERINEASLDLLATVGVEVPHEETLREVRGARGAGGPGEAARADTGGTREKCLGTAGKS